MLVRVLRPGPPRLHLRQRLPAIKGDAPMMIDSYKITDAEQYMELSLSPSEYVDGAPTGQLSPMRYNPTPEKMYQKLLSNYASLRDKPRSAFTATQQWVVTVDGHQGVRYHGKPVPMPWPELDEELMG